MPVALCICVPVNIHSCVGLFDPRRNSGLCHVCTGGKQHKAQKENGLVSGL